MPLPAGVGPGRAPGEVVPRRVEEDEAAGDLRALVSDILVGIHTKKRVAILEYHGEDRAVERAAGQTSKLAALRNSLFQFSRASQIASYSTCNSLFSCSPGVVDVLLYENAVLVLGADFENVFKVDPSQALRTMHSHAAALENHSAAFGQCQHLVDVLE